jgi:anti-anti-sigma regulatory factor
MIPNPPPCGTTISTLRPAQWEVLQCCTWPETFDMLTLPLVRAALFTALDTRPGDLVVDLSEVRFCGVRGFVVLAAMAATTARCGIGYAVAGVGPHLDRAATQAWFGQRLCRHPNTAAAVTATRHTQARSHADQP